MGAYGRVGSFAHPFFGTQKQGDRAPPLTKILPPLSEPLQDSGEDWSPYPQKL